MVNSLISYLKTILDFGLFKKYNITSSFFCLGLPRRRSISVVLLGCVLLCSLLCCVACQSEHPALYKKEFKDPTQRHKLSRSLLSGIQYHYQGSAPEQMMLVEAKSYDPNYSEVHRELGIPYLKRGIAAGFYPHYENAVRADSTEWVGWRGYIYLFFYRDYQRAINDFDATDHLTPNMVDFPQSLSVDYLRGLSYLKLKDYPKSIAYFEKHIKSESEKVGFDYISPKTFLFKGLAHLESGDILKAKEAFETGIGLDDENADLLFWYAKVLQEQNKIKEARQNLTLSKINFQKGYNNERAYVDEFYQLYLVDIIEMEAEL